MIETKSKEEIIHKIHKEKQYSNNDHNIQSIDFSHNSFVRYKNLEYISRLLRKKMEFFICFFMIFTIMLTSTGNSILFANAQQSLMSQENASNFSSSNTSQIPNETLTNDNLSQSSAVNDNQSTSILEPIEQDMGQGEVGPPGPSGNNASISMNIVYINNGTPESTSEDSFVTTSATCNENDIPISGGYSVVKEDEDEDNSEINEIESIPNLLNNSWTINVEGDDLQVTPYVICLSVTQ